MLFDQFTQLEKQIQEGYSRVIGNQRSHTELVAFPDLSTFNYLTFALHASFRFSFLDHKLVQESVIMSKYLQLFAIRTRSVDFGNQTPLVVIM